MDETTLVDPAVQARLADNLLMKRIGVIGLPTYAIYRPKGIEQ